MSAGVFRSALYQFKQANMRPKVARCLVQPETFDATCNNVRNGQEPGIGQQVQEAIIGFTVQISRGKKQRGVSVSKVRLRPIPGTTNVPNTYKAGSSLTIPILSVQFLDEVVKPNARVSYLNTTWEVADVTPEEID